MPKQYWVETDLNSPWYPVRERPPRALVKNYPEQHRKVTKEVWDALRAAWDNLNAASNRVDEEFPEKS